ncbi:MAG: TonB-dependent receptor [Gemmatimonadota bacterium]|nr:TonB-dependent receptor [Gemmatimonadota bacterium]
MANGPAVGVVVSSGSIASQTDANGQSVLRLPAGRAFVRVRRLGVAPDSARLDLRPGADTSIVFLLREQAASLASVVISSTRIERRVEDEPLRVEVLAGEDVGEKTQMRPADLRLLLTEMSGVRVQTTSPSLGASTVRVQGLRGRYTQILTDGLPLYGAQAGSFGLLQIPPLELRQAEVIKGVASALYGPGALGGVLNLVSRRPPDSSEAIVNQTARGGTDVVAFGAWDFVTPLSGVTLLGGVHTQRAADVDDDGWSDVPGFRRAELRPRLFLSDSAGRSVMVTVGAFAEDRGGGSASDAPLTTTFPESLTTRHADIGAMASARVSGAVSVAARFAANVQDRVRRFGVQRERERLGTVFGEVTSTVVAGAHSLVGGISAQYERYRNRDVPRFDDATATPAVFVQHTYAPTDWLSTQLNGRCDASSRYGTICSPRLSVLAHSGQTVNARLSGGAGWAAPSPLTEETEVFGLTRVDGPLNVAAERARTVSLDVGTTRGPFEVSGTLFASHVTDPVGLRRIAGDTMGRLAFVNAAGPTTVHGAELFAVYHEEPVIVTAYYAATRSRETSTETGRVRESPLVPRASAGLDAAFEEDESGTRVGVEAFYTGPQALEDNSFRTVSPAYTTVGVLASQRFGHATVYLNLENLTGVRQTRFDPLLRPTPGEGGRRTVDAWGPLEGRSANAGVRIRL